MVEIIPLPAHRKTSRISAAQKWPCYRAFKVKERPVKYSEEHKIAQWRVEDIWMRPSIDQDNVYFDGIKARNIFVQVWPSGRIAFIQKKDSRNWSIIGETSLTKLRAHLEKTGKARIYLPEVIPAFGALERKISPVQVTQSGKKYHVYTFYYAGIRFVYKPNKNAYYSHKFLSSRFYRQEHPDYVLIGIKKLRRFVPLGKIEFDAEGRVLKDGRVFLWKGKPIVKGAKKGQYGPLKEIVPELATAEKTFSFSERETAASIACECKANAVGRTFLISASSRNPITAQVRKGKVKIRISPERIQIYAGKNKLGEVSIDQDNNITSPAGEKLCLSDRQKINLLPFMPQLDIEKGLFTNYQRSEEDPAEINMNYNRISFCITLPADHPFSRMTKTGEIYWKRRANKIILLRKGISDPLTHFSVNLRANAIILRDGTEIPIPANRRFSLERVLPILRMDAQKLMQEFAPEHIDDIIVKNGEELVLAAALNLPDRAFLFGEQAFFSKYLYSLKSILKKIAARNNNVTASKRIAMFLITLHRFMDVLQWIKDDSNYNSSLKNVRDQHMEDLVSHIDTLKSRFGYSMVKVEFQRFRQGVLWSYVAPLFA